MARKSYKAKEPVRIRFKELANGNKSIYLDMNIQGKRRYEFLKLYLIPERTAADRLQNEQTMRAANAIKSQYIIDAANDAAGITKGKGEKVLLVEWMRNYPRTQAQQSKSVAKADAAVAIALQQYAGIKTRLADIDRDFCTGFIHFLTHDYKGANGQPLAVGTARTYYGRFVCALNVAVRNDLIAANPTSKLSGSDKIKRTDAQRCYLTQDEVLRLVDAEPGGNAPGKMITKQAFLFSCFCGLRISDIRALEWRDITSMENGQMRLEKRMQKTKELLYVPLSKQAQAYLPERGTAPDNAKVFAGLPVSPWVLNKHVKDIAAAAGISKYVTFHTARHTFATLLLTKGADIYTTSKLLGHTQVSTTQIYAKIIDEKKQEAVSLLDSMFN